MMDPSQFSNPYLQGNPLMPQLSPEMQQMARQRSMFNAGAAMLGSSGGGGNLLSGLSAGAQAYSGSLDAMMREGLQYQSMAKKAEHEKDLYKLKQDELKLTGDIAKERNATTLKAAGMQNALEVQRAKREDEMYKRSQAVGQSFGKTVLEGKGYSFGKNPLEPGAMATLMMREGTPEQQAQYLALTGTADATRAFAPQRFNTGSQFGDLLGGQPAPSAPVVDAIPKTSDEFKAQEAKAVAAEKVNAALRQNDKLVGEAKELKMNLTPDGGNMSVAHAQKVLERLSKIKLEDLSESGRAEYLDLYRTMKRYAKSP